MPVTLTITGILAVTAFKNPVADTPVSVTLDVPVVVTEPTAVVASTPVTLAVPCAKTVTDPTAVVASDQALDLPHPASPQSPLPQPSRGTVTGMLPVADPTAEVAATPVKLMVT